MGKQINPQVIRFCKSEDWISKYFSDYFNYSNLIVQDSLIINYIFNFLSFFNTKIVHINIYREESDIIIRLFSYNDSFINWKSFLLKHKKKIHYRDTHLNLFSRNFESTKTKYNFLKLKSNYCSHPISQVLLKKNGSYFKLLYLNSTSKKIRRLTGYSGKRLLCLNLSYLLKTNVILKNINIITKKDRYLVLQYFRNIGYRLRSPLSKYLRVKFVCLVYYSFLYKSSLLFCRYLCYIIPRFCKKKRKGRKLIFFLSSLKSVIMLICSSGLLNKECIKGLKIIIKGRINGSRRKRSYTIKHGLSSTQSFSNKISYYKGDCLTIFGILGVKVWIIY